MLNNYPKSHYIHCFRLAKWLLKSCSCWVPIFEYFYCLSTMPDYTYKPYAWQVKFWQFIIFPGKEMEFSSHRTIFQSTGEWYSKTRRNCSFHGIFSLWRGRNFMDRIENGGWAEWAAFDNMCNTVFIDCETVYNTVGKITESEAVQRFR